MTDRPIRPEDFNKMNSVAIFMGPLMNMYPRVSAKEIKVLLDRGEEFSLINVLDEGNFEYEHICGSINIPIKYIESEAPKLIAKNDLVIIYSTGPNCTASAVGADKLKTIGFENVMRYEGGIEEWKKTGFCLEGKGHGTKKAA